MAQAWYTFPRVDNFGTTDPAGPYWKPDSNIQLPGNYPVTALLSGTVTNEQTTAWGQHVITIKLDTPVNSLATHTFYEHMSGFAPGLAPGQHVSSGQLIGYNNPSGQVPLGFGFYSGDTYGSGDAWSILQSDLAPGGQGLLNPVGLLNSFASGQTTVPTSYDSTSTTTNPINLGPLGTKVGIFLIGLVLIIIGIYALFHKQIDSAVETGAKTAGKVALL